MQPYTPRPQPTYPMPISPEAVRNIFRHADDLAERQIRTGDQLLTWALSPGEYLLGDIYLKSGSAPLTYSGAGRITLTYREAVL